MSGRAWLWEGGRERLLAGDAHEARFGPNGSLLVLSCRSGRFGQDCRNEVRLMGSDGREIASEGDQECFVLEDSVWSADGRTVTLLARERWTTSVKGSWSLSLEDGTRFLESDRLQQRIGDREVDVLWQRDGIEVTLGGEHLDHLVYAQPERLGELILHSSDRPAGGGRKVYFSESYEGPDEPGLRHSNWNRLYGITVDGVTLLDEARVLQGYFMDEAGVCLQHTDRSWRCWDERSETFDFPAGHFPLSIRHRLAVVSVPDSAPSLRPGLLTREEDHFFKTRTVTIAPDHVRIFSKEGYRDITFEGSSPLRSY